MTGTEPTESPSPPACSRRTRMIVIAIAAVVVIAVVVIVIVKANHHSKTLSPATSIPAPSSQLNTNARQLVDLLQQGRKVTYHATYTTTGAAATQANLMLEIWQSPPHVREDTTRTQGSTTNHAAVFTDGTATDLCSEAAGAGWTCQAVSSTTFQDSGPTGIVAGVTASLAGRPVTTSKETIGGRSTRCFQVGTAAAGVKVCVTDQGIPALISTATVSYQLSTLSTTVPAATFTLPAPVK